MCRYLAVPTMKTVSWCRAAATRELAREAFRREKNGETLVLATVAMGQTTKFNLFNSRRIDAMDVTSKTEPHQ